MRLLPQKTVPGILLAGRDASMNGTAKEEGCRPTKGVGTIQGLLVSIRQIRKAMHLLRCSQGVGQARPERRSPSTRVALTRCGTENGHHLAAVDPADEEGENVALQQVELIAFAQVDGDSSVASPFHGFCQTAMAAEDV